MATEPFKTEAEFWTDYQSVQHAIELACGEINCLITRLPQGCIAIHGFAANEHDLRAAAQRLALCAPDSCRSIVAANTLKLNVAEMEAEGRHDFALAVPSKKASKAKKKSARRGG
jgi:hypothetical protein